jgi:hypothetical protein
MERREFDQTARRGGTHASDARHGFLASAIYPLSLWRTLRANEFEASDLAAIEGLLAKTVLFGQPKWRDAVAGDVPAAVAVAVSLLPIDNVTFQVDLAMTALIRGAIEGDFAAAIVVANILRHLPGSMLLHRRIATSWWVSNLTALRVLTRKDEPTANPGVTAPAPVTKRVNHVSRKSAAPKALKHRRTVPEIALGAPRPSHLSLVSALFGDREDAS